MRVRDRLSHRGATCHDGHAIGLDLGATTVRAAILAVRVRDGVPHVVAERLGGLPLEPGIIVNGVVANGPALTAALKELWKVFDLGCRNVVLGVANPQVQVRELQVPALDPEQQARALPFQARELLAMPLDQVVLDFAPLGEVEGEGHLINGLLVASPREPVMTAVAAVEAAGLKVVRVDLSALAVLRSAAEAGLAAEAVLDLGAHLTTIVVHQHGVPKLARTLTRGGDELTRRLGERLGIGLQEAEEAKVRDGLVGRGEVSTVLTELVAPLLTDIRSSLNYFRTGNAAARIEQVSLTGRAALLPGLAEALSAQVGAEVRVAEPGRLLEAPPKGKVVLDQRWATAMSVGLSIGAAA
jgi:type IV pilus assembly protein PilM